jgi:hypothetical protein
MGKKKLILALVIIAVISTMIFIVLNQSFKTRTMKGKQINASAALISMP